MSAERVRVRVKGVLGREDYVLGTPDRKLRACVYFGRGVILGDEGRLGGGIRADAEAGDALVAQLPAESEVCLARAFIIRKRGSASSKRGSLTAFVDTRSRDAWVQARMAQWRRELCATTIEPLTKQKVQHEAD